MRREFKVPLPLVQGETSRGTAYRRYGRGRPVVLIHGVGMSQQVWAPQLASLAGQYEVVTYDLLGHGESTLPPPEAKLAHYTEQTRHLLEELELSAAAVIGHSMGALVAIDFAVHHPERCLALVALNAVFCRTPEQRLAVKQRAAALRDVGSDANVDETIRRWFGEPVPEDLLAAAQLSRGMLKNVQPAGYERAYAVFAAADAEHAQSLHRLRVPALFATGDGDPNSTPAMSRAMAERVANAELAVLMDTRHMMCLTDPERANALLGAFLQRTLS